MRYIHPFPARMAPEIALEKISELKPGQTVLDPMSGSGMVLAQASKLGISSIGYDLDPLARLISQVGATRVSEKKVAVGFEKLFEAAKVILSRKVIDLPWISDDPETSHFIDFWFDEKQKRQLQALSHCLVHRPCIKNDQVLSILKIAVSRLIITKEPKASLARDTAHSRPHRTITENYFDIINELKLSTSHVVKALGSQDLKCDAKTYLGDARNMGRIKNDSIDAIVTSPPYLNAIDYMRGHRLSLVWMGYNLSQLRRLRSRTIGSERMEQASLSRKFVDEALGTDVTETIEARTLGMLGRYFIDLRQQTKEAFRVLKKGSFATYVMGNSNVRGTYIRNSEILKFAAIANGFDIASETVRAIPDSRRYMPIPKGTNTSLGTRMREEHVIVFAKA